MNIDRTDECKFDIVHKIFCEYIVQKAVSIPKMFYKLTEIDRKQLPFLRNLYAANASTNYISYVTVDTYMRWFEQDPDFSVLTVTSLGVLLL